MARRVRSGDRLAITVAEHNRLLAAADAISRDKLADGVGYRTHMRDASTVRVQNKSEETVPVFGFDSPIGQKAPANSQQQR